MNKLLPLAAMILVCSNTAFASDKQASALGVSLGYTSVYGDLSDIDSSNLTIGVNYTFDSGMILGLDYTPRLIDESETNNGVTAKLKTDVFTPYLGYQDTNGVRLIAGLAFADSDASFSYEGELISGSNMETGIMFGVGYLFDNNVSLDGKFATLDVGGIDGTMTTVSLGYKF